MIANLTIIDGFFQEPEVIRQFALSHDFTQAPEFDGHTYPGFAPIKDPRFTAALERRLADAIGSEVKVKMGAFVAGKEGFSTQQWIHSDNSCASFAGVCYLFDKPTFGTMFWRHQETGAHGLQSHRSALKDVDDTEFVERLREEGRDFDAWHRTDYADSRFNRLIFYPTDRFHSRWPETAFGDAPENCRLTLAFFFDLC